MISTPILIIIAAVIAAAFWRPILKLAVAAAIIGFAFLFITGLQDIVHSLHALIP